MGWSKKKKKFYNSSMQNWLDDDDVLMHSTHNEGKSVVAERFLRSLKGWIYKKLRANDSKPYRSYLNKLADKYNKTYHHSFNNKTYWCWLFCFKQKNQIES